jgi:uncharacterized protein YndB with AHSA1/START domain
MSRRENERAEPESERSLTISRMFEVPAHILFLACSKPEHMRDWFGPPGYPLTMCEMDFRVGGKYRFAMTGPDGVQMPPFGGEYLSIEPNRKISYTNRFEQPGAPTMVVTITFTEQAGKTRLDLHTLFETVAMKNEHTGRGYVIGVNAGLDQLEALTQRLAQS